MQLRPRRTLAPPAILTLADAKLHLRIEDSDQDAIVAGYLASAVSALDGPAGALGGYCLGRQGWTSYADGFPAGGIITLPLKPALSVTDLRYLDAAGVEQVLPATDWMLAETADGAVILRPEDVTWPETAPRPDAVRIAALYGHEVGEVPQELLQAVRLLTAHYYENRSASAFGGGFGQLPMGVEQLTMAYRRLAEIA